MSRTIGVDSDVTRAATRRLREDADTFDSQVGQAPGVVDAGEATVLLAGVLGQVFDSGARLNARATTLAGLADESVCDLLSTDADAEARLDLLIQELRR